MISGENLMSEIRWNLARNTALKVRELYNLKTARLPILDLIDKIPDLKIMTYREMVTEINNRSPDLHPSIDWVAENLADGSQDAAIIKMSIFKEKIILYQDETATIIPERIRFTIAHELGHYFLEHTFSNSLGRNGIKKENYKIMEKEADAFAQTLLIPPPALFDGESAEEIIKLHDVSKTAAKIAISQTHYSYRIPVYKPNFNFSIEKYTRLPSSFSLFDRSYFLSSYAIHCHNCGGISVFDYNKRLRHCNYCASDNIHVHDVTGINFNFYERVVPYAMVYTGIDVNSQGKATKCPVCDNEDITDGDYCQICGHYIVNKCSGYNDEFISKDEEEHYNTGERGCGTSLTGNSRYCPVCGSWSTFFFQGILTEWKKAKSELEFSTLPF